MLKPYMHGYFLSLKLYDAARVIANPFEYAQHREKVVKEKMEKMAETRIRTKKAAGVKVNKALAEKVLKEEERSKKREERRRARKAEREGAIDAMAVDGNVVDGNDENVTEEDQNKPTLLTDPRFSRLFEDPDFAVDENSREYALMNPSAVAQKTHGTGRAKTAVEEEEDESDKASSDGLEDEEGDSEDSSEDKDGSDSSDAGGKIYFHWGS